RAPGHRPDPLHRLSSHDHACRRDARRLHPMHGRHALCPVSGPSRDRIRNQSNGDRTMDRFRLSSVRAIIRVVPPAIPPSIAPPSAPAQAATPAPSAIDALPQVVITATDYRLDLPMTIAAGRVAVTLENDGAEPHHAALLKLNDGVTPDQLQAA